MGRTTQKMLSTPIQRIKGRPTRSGHPFVFLGTVFLVVGLLGNCRQGETSGSAATATTPPATVSASPELEPPVALTQPAVPATSPDAGHWIYEETRTGYKAVTVSPTVLNFPFPYDGGSTATLTLRRRSGETHVYIDVSKGQFNRSFQGGTARVRFDNRPAVSYPLVAAANGRANILFFANEQSLIDQLRKARTMVVTVEFAGQDTRDIQFGTANLQWKQAKNG